jgi:hypothetical protein
LIPACLFFRCKAAIAAAKIAVFGEHEFFVTAGSFTLLLASNL